MNIVEFLEARVTEDEAARTHIHVMPQEVVCPCGDLGVISEGSPEHLKINHPQSRDTHTILRPDLIKEIVQQGGLSDEAKRWVAECKAKRALIEAAKRSDLDAGSERREIGYAEGLEEALVLLAQVHVDHADFDPEWTRRPGS